MPRRWFNSRHAPKACYRVQNQAYQGESYAEIVAVLAVALIALAGISASAQAQTKPVVTTLGPDFPKTEIFIGNSFFYYNNGMPGHVSLMEKAADPAHKQAYRATIGDDRRLRLRLA